MKKILMPILVAFISLGLTAQEKAVFTSTPSLDPAGQTAYFAYAGDIWKVATNGGVATRVTALEGEETNPKVSPDGKWLAFSSNQYGNNDVFVMPIEGGAIRQLTYHSAKDDVESWSWDSQTIYFTSNRDNNFGSYSVALNGGTPKRLFTNYFNFTNGLVVSPSGEYIFTNSTEAQNQAQRKHYKGANNPDILGYSPTTKVFKQYTTYLGKDFNPSIDKKGNIYFISDENNGQYNLYRLTDGKKQALTEFSTSIKSPSVSADGNSVIFEKDYQLFLYEVATGQTKALTIDINPNKMLDKAQSFQTAGNISNFDVSPDGKKMAFVSRGVLFVSDIEGKFIRPVTTGEERVMEVKWLKDNRTLLFNQTFKGWQNWFTVNADGSGNLKQVTNDERNNRDITLNHRLTQAVYLSGRDQVRVLDLSTFTSNTIAKDEIWGFQNSKPSFSPNDEYVLFSARRNFELDIFIHNLKTSQTENLTNTGVTEEDPVWSPDGKYIYFSSDRTSPSYPLGAQKSNIYRLALDWFDQPYKSAKFDDLFKPEVKADSATTSKKKKNKKTVPPPVKEITPKMVVNPTDILDRVELVTDRFGFQTSPQVFMDGKKQYLFYNSNQDNGKRQLYRKTFEDFAKPDNDRVFSQGVSDMVLNHKNLYGLSGGSIYKFGLTGTPAKIDISYRFNKDLASEFDQMFYETWAGLQENYYDGTFHGVDWESMKKEYAQYLPYVNNRNDLRILLNDMLGELNSSHMGFYSSGSEEKPRLNYVTSETGLIYKEDQPFVVEKIVRKSPAFLSGVDIRPGDRLVAVNGVKVDEKQDRESYFTFPEMKDELSLDFIRNGKRMVANIHPVSNVTLKGMLYDDWIHQRKEMVDQWGNNKIAYVYLKNMSTQSLDQFLLDMVAQEQRKEGLIVDIRYNTGGNIHDKVLKFLEQRPYLKWKYRDGQFAIQPNFAPSGKPIVLLVNEHSLSDAEVTSAGFKALKLGKVIGTETYRWIIFTSAKSLVDGSSYRLPAWGVYTLDGQDLEHSGVSPDIYVKNTFTDRLRNADPQLKAAVEEVLKELK